MMNEDWGMMDKWGSVVNTVDNWSVDNWCSMDGLDKWDTVNAVDDWGVYNWGGYQSFVDHR